MLWDYLTPDQVERIRSGDVWQADWEEEPEEAIFLAVPLWTLTTWKRSFHKASQSIREGRPSRSTDKPIEVLYDPDKDVFLITDGQHRFAAAVARGDKTASIVIWHAGYNDFYAIPDREDRYRSKKPRKKNSRKNPRRRNPTRGTQVRPWSQAAEDAMTRMTRPGHYYRGMTEVEYEATVGRGRGARSRQDFSAEGEGTSFAREFADAESYVNFGRTDPRVTGVPNYIVEVRIDHVPRGAYRSFPDGPRSAVLTPDGYVKVADPGIPQNRVTNVWRMEPRGDVLFAVKARKS